MFGSRVKLDRGLLERCRRAAKVAGYSSVEEFIAHVLERELKKLEQKIQGGGEEEVMRKLKGLGYVE